ncbi:MAG TPA: hypothetical protein VFL58_15790 [Gaiellaceae bacterium]|nr:hypothetical protein [Gaiellaceae bacterium]
MTTKTQQLNSDDVQTLDNVFAQHRLPPLTRRALLATAAGAAVAASVPGIASAASSDSAMEIGTAAVTAEALAVTYLSNLIKDGGHSFPKPVQNVLKAANHAEQDHYTALHGLGFKPLTTRFWIPNAAFNPKNAAPIIEYLESVFVNAYLIGTTAFAAAGKADFARYTVEIGAVEAEHRTLARALQGKLGDNLAFTSYTVKTIPEIVSAIEQLGIGFGKETSTPGRFFTYHGPLPGTTVALDNNAPS